MFGQTNEAPVGAPLQFLSFCSGGEECAVELARVREIVRYQPLTRVPRAAACVRGVLNVRGSVVPVLDLALGLGLPETPVGEQTCVLVVELLLDGESVVMGLLASEVKEVLDLPPGEIEPPPSFGTRVPVAALRGLTRVRDRFVLLLDLDRLLGEGSVLGLTWAGATTVTHEGDA